MCTVYSTKVCITTAALRIWPSNYSARVRKQKFKLPWSYNPAQSMELA